MYAPSGDPVAGVLAWAAVITFVKAIAKYNNVLWSFSGNLLSHAS